MRAPFACSLVSILVAATACGDSRPPPTDGGSDGGVLVVDSGSDSGQHDAGPSYLFGPCTTDDQCPGPDEVCRTAADDGWAGGFCTRTCMPPDRGPCDDGVIYNHCLEQTDGSGSYCEQRCLNGVDCMRDGYTCVGDFGGGAGMCVPICSSDEECGGGTQCNPWAGTCVPSGGVPTNAVHGDPCTANADCRSEQCLLERSTAGTPTGWNGGYCYGPCILPNGYNTNTFFDGTALPQGTCPEGDVCFVNGSYTRGDLGACLHGCATDADCRGAEGYSCLKDFDLPSGGTSSYTNGVCLPIDCNVDDCPTGYMCQSVATASGTRYVCERM